MIFKETQNLNYLFSVFLVQITITKSGNLQMGLTKSSVKSRIYFVLHNYFASRNCKVR